MACDRDVRGASPRLRPCQCARGILAGIALLFAALSAPPAVAEDPIKAGLEAKVQDGYARLVFNMNEYDDASARLDGSVLIITFKHPLDITVDRLAAQLPAYISAARRDPDGRGVRMALAQPVTLNTTSTGQKFFVDLLPRSWSGPPPGLPAEVIAALARRAREADRLERKQRGAAQQQADAEPVRVHVAAEPTFTRYVFDVPVNTAVSADQGKDKLTLTFDSPIKFDLGDALASLPGAITGIDAEVRDASSVVRFSFADKVDIRTFRDAKGYAVDILDARGDVAHQAPVIPPQGAPPLLAPTPQPSVAAPPAVIAPEHGAARDPTQEDASAAPPKIATPTTLTAPVAPVSTPPPTVAQSAIPPSAGPPAPPVKPVIAAEATQPQPPQTMAAVPEPPAPPPATPPEPSPPQAKAAVTPPGKVNPANAKGSAAGGKVAVDLVHDGALLKLSFPFPAPTAAAAFQRADTLWLIFDTNADLDLSALDHESSHVISAATLVRSGDADIIRLKLDRPHLSSVAVSGSTWTVQIGDSSLQLAHSLDLTRNLIGPNRSAITIPFDKPHQLHRVSDSEAGDQLIVVTAFGPTRGLIDTKDFIEFRALGSAQGIVIEPLADDIDVELMSDKVVVSRPIGLALSTSLQTLLRGSGMRPMTFDSQLWGFDQKASYAERQSALIAAAAAAPEGKRLAPRLDLARFYVARDMYPEAKGVLDVALTDDRSTPENVPAIVLRAVTEIMMERPAEALKDLSDPTVGEQHDAGLWRALALAREGKWAEARNGFRRSAAAINMLPVKLQRVALNAEMRADIEVGDLSGAQNQLNDFETIGVPHDLEPAVAVLMGRLAEGLGRAEDALTAYRTAADSWDRGAAAQGELRETLLRYAMGDLKRDDVISELETLTTIWRGDDTEIEALQMLARLYTEEGRYRDSFYVMRSAMAAHPNSDMTHRIQEEAAATFDSLFLAGKGDSLPAIDALSLFYDFRELTPIGRRGDEMIRRLADRLVSVDLLDQAAGLLQYQVDNRLEGAARAQVATRLAVIYLMNRKPDRALAVLRASRTADLANELRSQRLLLEARALSDIGRHDLALEVIANVPGREAIRLRSDIYWAGKHWRQAGEQIELMYGDRWKQWQPLNEVERSDILRAEIGYALGADTLGLNRFREKYAAKMAQTPDAHAFDVVSAAIGTSGAEFGAIAHAAAAVDTLDSFLREMQARYPDSNAISPAASDPPPGAPAAAASPSPPAKPDEGPKPPPRAFGRTAQR